MLFIIPTNGNPFMPCIQGRDKLRYNCRCSCLEIYNESITDLLNPSATNLQLREDPARGIYVDGLSEKEVLNGECPSDTELYLKIRIEPSRPILNI